MADTVIRFEDYSGKEDLPGCWWYCRAGDTGAAIAIQNPRMEPDYDEDGYTGHSPDYDALRIRDAEEWRELTDEESDEYADDVRKWLRYCDWV